jgi:uncharacterized protein YqjF (DUF2071 family)
MIEASSRPWPKSQRPWVMEQVWHDLLFIHWPISVELLRPLIPRRLSLDTYNGQAWLGIVPFRMSGIHPRGFPSIPGLSAFPELNVRTYVTDGSKPGVYFFSLEAGNPFAVLLAKAWFHLPYYWAMMSLKEDGEGNIHYRSRRLCANGKSIVFAGRYRPVGPVFLAKPGELLHWLTERYCLYTTFLNGEILRGEIHHMPWPLQQAELSLEVNSMHTPLGLDLSTIPPLLHFARRQDVQVWPLEKLVDKIND